MTVRSMIRMAALVAASFVGTAWADFTFQPGDVDWGTALTVVDGETIILDAGDDANWAGTVTVEAGGTLKTRGGLAVNGATTVALGGTIDIETGNASFNFNSKGITGSVIIRSDAVLAINRSDAFFYNGGFSLHVYGTFDCRTFRQSFNNIDRLYLYDGAKVIGVGDGNGGMDFYADGCRMIVQGTSTIEAPVRARNANQNLNVACHDNAHVKFLGGFVGGGNVVQIAATA